MRLLHPVRVRRWVVACAAAVWILLLSASLLWNWRHLGDSSIQIATMEARASIEKDLFYRGWVANHGGVYVPPTDKTPPNPFLAHLPDRDLVTTGGKQLTLINPAYMSRQVQELAGIHAGLRSHVSSLRPLRPENRADAWEAEALRAFESGAREVSALVMVDGARQLRLMRPLVTEPACLKCHADHGYREGDIRGGLSVSVPLAPFTLQAKRQLAPLAIGHGLIAILGLAGLWAGSRLLRSSQAALRESEQAHRALSQAAFEGLMVHDRGTILTASQVFAELFGFTAPEELVGKSVFEVLPLTPASRSLIMEHQRSPPGEAFAITAALPDGTARLLDTRAREFEYRGRQVRAVAVRDITESRRSEAALRQSQLLLQSTVESAPMILFTLDCDGVFQISTGAGLKSLGLKPGEVVGRSHFEVYRDLGVANSCARRALKGESVSFAVETPGVVWDVRYSPLRDLSGGITGMVGTALDVTAAARAEQELRRERNRARQYLETVEAIIVALDAEGRVTLLNRKGCAVLGVTEAEALGKNWFSSFLPQPEGNTLVYPVFAKIMSGIVEGVSHFENAVLTKSGERRLTAWHSSVLRDDNGVIVGALSAGEDITERRRAEEEREKLRADLAQAQKLESVGRLAGGVAHDFNNMLGVILGHAELALRKLGPDHPIRSDLEDIRKAAERSASLTRQLLAFARKQTVAPKVVDLNETVAGLLKMLNRLIGEDIELAWRPHPGLWPVRIDPAQIDQILVNLAVNARQAIAGTGTVTIETKNVVLDEASSADQRGFAPGEYVSLVVRDDGQGVDRHIMEHIFEPFFTTKGVGQGTGLGLATVYGIVTQNAGFVSVESEQGQGTTFRIYLPRTDATIGDTTTTEATKPHQGQGETVLLVEDEPMLLHLGKRMLERLGYLVLSAASPRDAIRLAASHSGSIELLITDVVMPELDGKQVATQIQASRPGLKCLFTSGYTADVIATHGVLEEGVQFVQKPFSITDLAAKVRQVLEQ